MDQQPGIPPYLDPMLPWEVREDDLLSRMTLQMKVLLTSAAEI